VKTGSLILFICIATLFGCTTYRTVTLAPPDTLRPQDLYGKWVSAEGTAWELDADSTYDMRFADMIDIGRWTLKKHGKLELVPFDDPDKKTFSKHPVAEVLTIERFGGTLMYVRMPYRLMGWLKRK
jgi:hypothetical protein